MLGHSTFIAKPIRCKIKSLLGNSILSNVFTEFSHFWALVFTLLADVCQNRFRPLMLNYRAANFSGYSATATKSLWPNPIRKTSISKFFLHRRFDSFYFGQRFFLCHRRSIFMRATSNNDCETVPTVISKSNLLMGSAKNFDNDIRNFNFSHFELWGIDNKNLRCNRSLVFGSSEENTVS